MNHNELDSLYREHRKECIRRHRQHKEDPCAACEFYAALQQAPTNGVSAVAQSDVASAKVEVAAARAQVSELQKRLAAEKEKFEAFLAKGENIASDLGDAHGRIAELDSELDKAREQIKELETSRVDKSDSDLQKEVDLLESALSEIYDIAHKKVSKKDALVAVKQIADITARFFDEA